MFGCTTGRILPVTIETAFISFSVPYFMFFICSSDGCFSEIPQTTLSKCSFCAFNVSNPSALYIVLPVINASRRILCHSSLSVLQTLGSVNHFLEAIVCNCLCGLD